MTKRIPGRRQMKPWEVIATLLTAKQLAVVIPRPDYPSSADPERRAAIFCPRTGQEITLENVRTIQVEHWPEKHEHGGPVSPDNAVISLKEGHAKQTKKEAREKKHERKLRAARAALADALAKKGKKKKPTGWRWKKPVGGGRPVKVPTYE